MANEEQVALLKQGSEVWNKWREENPDVAIDLQFTNLSGLDLRGLDLSFANLYFVDFSYSNLSSADLSDAVLSFSKLGRANLSFADLRSADLNSADLRNANLNNADLSGALIQGTLLGSNDLCGALLNNLDFSGHDLSGFDLSKAAIRDVKFRGALLYGANLSGLDLRGFDLLAIQLRGADLRDTNLDSANLGAADLRGANFQCSSLNGANLLNAQVLYTNFTEAILTGACIADWQIGSSTILEGVKCDYIFRTYDTEKEQRSGRLPVDPDGTFAPGEFTQRFQIIASALETIDITFTEGIDWQAFFQSFQELRDSHPDEEISIQGMERKGKAFVVRLEVEGKADKGAIETEVKQFYAHQLAALEAQYEQRLQLQGVQIETAKQTIESERREKATLMGIMATMAENQGSKFDLRWAQIGGGVAETVQGDQFGGVINNYGQDADDIVSLLTALRTWSQALPEAQQDDVLMELDALEADLNKPEKPETKRLGKRLQRLIAAGMAAAEIANGAVTFSGNVNEFTDNVLELGEKVGLTREDIQAQP